MLSPERFPVYNKFIVAANPSFATEIERTFWRGFQGACTDRGWRLVKASARAIPLDDDTAIIPARLWELDEAFRSDEQFRGRRAPWISCETFDRYVEWEVRRWRVDSNERRAKIVSGLSKLVLYIDNLFQELCPAICLTTNKIDHGTGLFRDAAIHYGVFTCLIERSPIDSIWVEPDGIFSESKIWQKYDEREQRKDKYWYSVGRTAAIDIRQNPEGFRVTSRGTMSLTKDLKQLAKPLIFLPMDNILWTGWAQADHPQRILDYPLFDSPVAAIRALAEIVKELGGTLCVKRHPACWEIKDEELPDHVSFISGDLRTIIAQSDVIVAFNTKVAFAAMALSIPVVVLSRNPISASRATYHTEELTAIKIKIREALRREGFERKIDEYYRFLGWLKSEYFYEAQIDINSHRKNQIDLINRLERDVADMPVLDLGRDMKKQPIREMILDRSKWKSETDDPCPVMVDVDVSRLANTRVRYSGITRYAEEMLAHFKEQFEETRAVIFDSKEIVAKFGAPIDKFADYIGMEVHEVSGRVPGRILFSPYGPLPNHSAQYDARVLTVHDCFHATRKEFYFGHDGIMTDKIIESIDPSSDFVVCDSVFTMRDLFTARDLKADRVFAVPLAAGAAFSEVNLVRDETFLRNVDLANKKYIVAWCQVDARKNAFGTMLSVAKVLEEDNNGLSAVFITSEAEKDRVRAYLDELGLSRERGIIVSNLLDEELAALYRRAELVVFTPYLEGFGLPLIEAMTTGCPVVVSATSSLTEIGGDACLYADPWDPATISDAINTLARSSSLRSILAKRSVKRASLFSWQRTGALTSGVVEKAARSQLRGGAVGPDQDGASSTAESVVNEVQALGVSSTDAQTANKTVVTPTRNQSSAALVSQQRTDMRSRSRRPKSDKKRSLFGEFVRTMPVATVVILTLVFLAGVALAYDWQRAVTLGRSLVPGLVAMVVAAIAYDSLRKRTRRGVYAIERASAKRARRLQRTIVRELRSLKKVLRSRP